MSSARKQIQFPPHKVSLTLEHNGPRNVYRTVREVCEAGDEYYRADAWVSEEQRQKAIATNDVWTLQWYPETPVGFCVLHAADLDVLLAFANSEPAQ